MIGATNKLFRDSREFFRASDVAVHPVDGTKRSVVNTYQSSRDLLAVFEETPLDGHQSIG